MGTLPLNESLVHDAVLLLLTAVLTGLLVPFIKGRMDDRKFREQKQFEADIVRQGKLIEAQVKFLEDLARLLWAYQYLCAQVAYFKVVEDDPEKYEQAKRAFYEKCWDCFIDLRTEASKAQRLLSDETHAELMNEINHLYDIDRGLVALIRRNAPIDDWRGLNERLRTEEWKRTDKIIYLLAAELKLKSPPAKEAPASVPKA